MWGRNGIFRSSLAELCPPVPPPTVLREGTLLQNNASCPCISPTLYHCCFFPRPMFSCQLLRSWRFFLLDFIILMLSGETRNQSCSCLPVWLTLQIFLTTAWVSIYDQPYETVSWNISVKSEFSPFFTVSWGHLSFFLDIFSLWVSSGWSIYFFRQPFLCTLKDSLLFANPIVHVTLLNYWYACS